MQFTSGVIDYLAGTDQLACRQNPLSQEHNYRLHMIHHLPNLHVLDRHQASPPLALSGDAGSSCPLPRIFSGAGLRRHESLGHDRPVPAGDRRGAGGGGTAARPRPRAANSLHAGAHPLHACVPRAHTCRRAYTHIPHHVHNHAPTCAKRIQTMHVQHASYTHTHILVGAPIRPATAGGRAVRVVSRHEVALPVG